MLLSSSFPGFLEDCQGYLWALAAFSLILVLLSFLERCLFVKTRNTDLLIIKHKKKKCIKGVQVERVLCLHIIDNLAKNHFLNNIFWHFVICSLVTKTHLLPFLYTVWQTWNCILHQHGDFQRPISSIKLGISQHGAQNEENGQVEAKRISRWCDSHLL